MKNHRTFKSALLNGITMVMAAVLFMQCEFNLLDEGSLEDLTPPESAFSFRQDAENQLQVNFTNESNSATSFFWSFGDGNTSEQTDPSNVYEEFGTYTIMLVSQDNLGVVDTLMQDILVEEGPFQPIIFESGFEDFSPGAGDCDDGEGRSDGRDCWLNGDLGGIIQISTRSDATEPNDNIHNGLQSGKLPGPGDSERIGYQEVRVEANQDYRLNFFYNLDDNVSGGFITVSVLSGSVSSREEAVAATIGSFTGTDQSDPSTFVPASITFNSGDSEEIAIFFFNNNSVDARLDDLSLEVTVADFIPPTASFSAEPNPDNFLEYSFTNGSLNAENFFWDFGDGTTSTEENPVHTFPAIDTFTVQLVAESRFFTTDTFALDIVVPDPVAASFEFESDPDNITSVTFTNTSTDASSFLWDFGDNSGFFSTAESPSYTYAEEDVYRVTLTATGESGATSSFELELNLNTQFVVRVLNGTFDDFTANTGDNADAWDMTPNSTVVDNNGMTVDSPFRAIWNNSALEDHLEAVFNSGGSVNEQPSSSSDGANDTRGVRLNENTRRLYQLVEVQPNVQYQFSIDTRSISTGFNTQVFILNTEINTEEGINADASTANPEVDGFFLIDNDFDDSGNDVFTTNTFLFTTTTNQIVIYVRPVNSMLPNTGVVDNDNQVFIDNIEIIEP
ncbi:MAG: PKD domain-containing protein [Bacteroidota bacterium]